MPILSVPLSWRRRHGDAPRSSAPQRPRCRVLVLMHGSWFSSCVDRAARRRCCTLLATVTHSYDAAHRVSSGPCRNSYVARPSSPSAAVKPWRLIVAMPASRHDDRKRGCDATARARAIRVDCMTTASSPAGIDGAGRDCSARPYRPPTRCRIIRSGDSECKSPRRARSQRRSQSRARGGIRRGATLIPVDAARALEDGPTGLLRASAAHRGTWGTVKASRSCRMSHGSRRAGAPLEAGRGRRPIDARRPSSPRRLALAAAGPAARYHRSPS